MSVNQAIIDSDSGLLPVWHQAIIWTNAAFLLIGPSGWIFSGILIKTQQFSIKNMHLKMHLQKGGHFVATSMY